MSSEIGNRKHDHINAVLNADVRHRKTTRLEEVTFEHAALPELNFGDIDLRSPFLGYTLNAPFLISSMTGGVGIAKHINETIAEVCQSIGIGLAVGSQRIALEENQQDGLNKNIRRLAPSVPILANIGAAQLSALIASGSLSKLIDMIDADALIIHLNPLQEVLQPRGDVNWAGILKQIEMAVETIQVPLIVKEVGSGISASVAKQLWNVGVKIIDVAGSGGTSWAAVEATRAASERIRGVAETFRDWGIPTALSIKMIDELDCGILIIASGGMQNGLEAAQALRLGASIAGFAAKLLPAAIEGTDRLHQAIDTLIMELKITAFCTGSASIAELKKARIL